MWFVVSKLHLLNQAFQLISLKALCIPYDLWYSYPFQKIFAPQTSVNFLQYMTDLIYKSFQTHFFLN